MTAFTQFFKIHTLLHELTESKIVLINEKLVYRLIDHFLDDFELINILLDKIILANSPVVELVLKNV